MLVLVAYPLCNQRYSFLEVAKGRVLTYAFEAAINFIASSVCHFCAPGNDVVFEQPLIKLVVDVGGETLEYVGVG